MRPALNRSLAALLVLACGVRAQPAEPQEYVVDREASWLRVLIYRGGLFAGAGHNHVVASNDLAGTVTLAAEVSGSGVSLDFPVATLDVDDPTLRQAEGESFPDELSDRDIEGTRKNMLGPRLLDADRFADVRIVSREVSGALPDVSVSADVTIKGVSRQVVFPASVTLAGDVLIADGRVRVSHAELGLKPFSVLFGTLRVADEVLIKYHIVARTDDGAN